MTLRQWLRDKKDGLSRKFFAGGVQDYERRLAAEAAYWADFTSRWVRSGIIPPWGDTRLAISQLIANQHHDRILGAELENLSSRRTHLRRAVLRVRELAASGRGRVLDLGCGSGFLSLELSRQGASVTGIDCSPGQLAVAEYFGQDPARWQEYLFPRYNCVDLSPPPWKAPHYVCSDFNAWDPEPESFDILIAHDALHHARDLECIAARIVHALAPGGEALILEHQEPSGGLERTHQGLAECLKEFVTQPNENLTLPEFEAYPRQAVFPSELGSEIMSGLAERLREKGIQIPDTVTGTPDETPPPYPLEESAFEGADETDLGRRLAAAFQQLGLDIVLYEESINPWHPPLQGLRPAAQSWPDFYARRTLAERQVLDKDGLIGDGCFMWLRKP